jgi:hypothetical protein
MLAYHIRSASGFDNIISKNPGFWYYIHWPLTGL